MGSSIFLFDLLSLFGQCGRIKHDDAQVTLAQTFSTNQRKCIFISIKRIETRGSSQLKSPTFSHYTSHFDTGGHLMAVRQQQHPPATECVQTFVLENSSNLAVRLGSRPAARDGPTVRAVSLTVIYFACVTTTGRHHHPLSSCQHGSAGCFVYEQVTQTGRRGQQILVPLEW
jgi:hypothetical protein